MQSTTSTSTAFLSKVQPKISVIEVGAGNSYGHPTSATLGRLVQVGSAVYCTDLNGDVTVTTDGTTGRCKNRKGKQPASSQSAAGAVCDCSYNRYNCKDFSGHDAAQACNDYCISLGKGDIHQLDCAKDGLLCEG